MSVLSILNYLFALPFQLTRILVLTPIYTFLQILHHGFIQIPFNVILAIGNVALLPFTFGKPLFIGKFEVRSLLRDLEIIYQFVVCSIIFGIVAGIFTGISFCLINYLLSLQNATFTILEFERSPVKFFKKEKTETVANGLLKSSPSAPVAQPRQTATYIKKEEVDESGLLNDESIYEDDDGYHLKLPHHSTSSADEDGETNSTLTTIISSQNATASTSLTSFSEDKSSLRYRNPAENDYRETDSETATDTETETEDDQFYDPLYRRITTIEEE